MSSFLLSKFENIYTTMADYRFISNDSYSNELPSSISDFPLFPPKIQKEGIVVINKPEVSVSGEMLWE